MSLVIRGRPTGATPGGSTCNASKLPHFLV